MTDSETILIIEDSPALALTYKSFLHDAGHAAQIAGTLSDARAILKTESPAAILLDLNLPDGNGLDFLKDIRAQNLAIPVIVMTAQSSVDTAVEAIRAGAEDFIAKPVTAERLNLTLKNLLEKQSLKTIVARLERDEFCGFIGKSPAMQAVYRIIENAAQSRAPVFITGESGTGKELAARALHALSAGKNNVFEALNCAAIPGELMESEIFGHAKGAFTGAVSAYDGAALRAHQGTLFLDELTEMPAALQPKLLRFTQTGIFRPVGGQKEHSVDVRFVSATNRDPFEAVRDGKLREDLYYRLNVIPVHLPPLRERGDDAALIADSLLKRISAEEKKHFQALDDGVKSHFLSYGWPGNVRQLENTLRRAVVLHDGEILTMDMIPKQEDTRSRATQSGGIMTLKELEHRAIETALAVCGGNITEAARRLGVNPSTIHRKLGRQRG